MKRRYSIEITFLPNRKGQACELDDLRMTTGPMTKKDAHQLAYEEADRFWTDFNIRVMPIEKAG